MAAAAGASTWLALIRLVSLFLVEVELSDAVMSERPAAEAMKGVSEASCRDQP